MKELEWNPGEEMTKELAIATVDYMMQFCRRLYYMPNKEPFSVRADFESRLQELNGLKDYIIRLNEGK